ncbi:MAG: hypothetical protein WBA28_02005 [Microbacteriaceae bacterium]
MAAHIDRELNELPGTNNFRLDEFEGDLNAVWYEFDNEQQIMGWLGYPAMLRRLANIVASRIDSKVDRIISTGLAAGTIGTAVALEAGIPFAVLSGGINDDLALSAGVTHPEENIAIVSFWPDKGTRVLDWAASHGLHVSSWTVCVQNTGADAGTDAGLSSPQQALFQITTDGISAIAVENK